MVQNNPVRYPYRDARFYANDVIEYIEFFNKDISGRLVGKIPYSESTSEGTVTIDTTTATHATGTVTLASATSLVRAYGQITFNTSTAADEIEINGLVYTAVTGVKADNTEFSIDTSNDAAATDLADSINNDIRTGTLNNLTASSSTATVTVSQTVAGVSGNATTLTSTGGARVILSGATFANGTEAGLVTVNGLIYTAVSGARSDDTEFSIDTSDIAAATDLAAAITADVRVGTLNNCTASSGGTAVVTITTSVGGLLGNSTALTSSDGTTLAVSSATLTGGLDDASVSGITIDSVQIMSSAEFTGDDVNLLASQVADNINAFTSVPNYTAVSLLGEITIKAVLGGAEVNTLVVASTVVKATKTDAAMAGGATNIIDSTDSAFGTWDLLITWLEKNTGGTLIV